MLINQRILPSAGLTALVDPSNFDLRGPGIVEVFGLVGKLLLPSSEPQDRRPTRRRCLRWSSLASSCL